MQLAKDLAGDSWYLGALKDLYRDNFWTWAKKDIIGFDRDAYLGWEKLVDFEKELWFELGEYMWRKNRSVYQDHLKYVRNDIVNPFHVIILRYAKRVMEMHDLTK